VIIFRTIAAQTLAGNTNHPKHPKRKHK